jgi:hypothetical protein
MTAGRPAGLDLDDDTAVRVHQHVSDIDGRGRVYLPTWLISGLTWIQPNQRVLAVFDEPGLIRLCSWTACSGPVIARRKELAELGDFEGIQLLQDRYRAIRIPGDSRPILGESALVHLGLTDARSPQVYLVRVIESFRITAPAYRDRELARAQSSFASLP